MSKHGHINTLCSSWNVSSGSKHVPLSNDVQSSTLFEFKLLGEWKELLNLAQEKSIKSNLQLHQCEWTLIRKAFAKCKIGDFRAIDTRLCSYFGVYYLWVLVIRQHNLVTCWRSTLNIHLTISKFIFSDFLSLFYGYAFILNVRYYFPHLTPEM